VTNTINAAASDYTATWTGGNTVAVTATTAGVIADITLDLTDGGFVATVVNVTTQGAAAVPAGNIVGSDSTFASDNIINAGAGNDVIVLGTDVTGGTPDTTSNDTVVFTGNFGTTTIVNFQTGVLTAGGDILDFRAYLGGNNSTTIVTDEAALTQGQIAIENFTAGITVNGTAVTFANIETHLATLLKPGTAIIAGAANEFDGYVVNAATAVATENVMLIQNGTTGVYKVFDLGSAALSADFNKVQFVGVIDLGTNTVLTTDNLA